MAKSNAQRQREFQARRRELGFELVTVSLPSDQAGLLRMIARRLCEQPGLEFGPLREVATGKLVKRET